MELTRFKTPKGKDAFSINGYSYRFDKRAADGERFYWRCLESNCAVRMETVGERGLPTPRGQQDHTHASNGDVCLRRKPVHDMKEKAKYDTTPIPAIYDEVAVAVHEERPNVGATLPTLHSLKTSLYRARRSKYPKLPQNLADLLDIPPIFACTGQEHDVRFLLNNSLGDIDDGSLIMATDSCIRLLAENNRWFMDGTFKVAPRLFRQLFTVHVMLGGKVIPCVYSLMASKSKIAYKRVFRALKDYVDQQHLPALQPISIMTDFERAMMDAVDEEFPTAHSRGCLFHFTQALWRKLQGLGLQETYNEGAELQDCCRQMMALPFLPEAEIPNAFAWLSDLGNDLHPAMPVFIDYIDHQWVSNGHLPLAKWNCHRMDIRTNNAVEGWHSRFNRKVRVAHPNTWMLMEYIQQENSRSELLAAQIEGGARVSAGRSIYTQLNTRIQVLYRRKEDNELNIPDFLSHVGRLLHF